MTTPALIAELLKRANSPICELLVNVWLLAKEHANVAVAAAVLLVVHPCVAAATMVKYPPSEESDVAGPDDTDPMPIHEITDAIELAWTICASAKLLPQKVT